MPPFYQVADAYHAQVGSLSGLSMFVNLYLVALVLGAVLVNLAFNFNFQGVFNMLTRKKRDPIVDGTTGAMGFQLKVRGCPTCGYRMQSNGKDVTNRQKWVCDNGHHFVSLVDNSGLVDYQTGKVIPV